MGVAGKKAALEVRQDVRNYIRNERDTILKKWMALQETITAEDRRREEFNRRRLQLDTHQLPKNIRKFIGTLKKSVRKTMRNIGGTPFSIIRNMFIYWDADRSGEISADEMEQCVKSLGVKMTKEEIEEVIEYYDTGKGTNEMAYDRLLQDVLLGEPTIIEVVEQEPEIAAEDRFEEEEDQYKEMPKTVFDFIEATQSYIQVKMRNEGGTPFEHVRNIFTKFDFSYSNGLDASQLRTAAFKMMKLTMTEKQAKEIIEYYDRKKIGRMTYTRFVVDVCQGVKSILTFTELTPEVIEQQKQKLSANPFIPRPFKALPSKVLEKYKRNVKLALAKRITDHGGTISQIVTAAFQNYDPRCTGKVPLSDWERLVAITKKFDVNITKEEAISLINSYDRDGDGAMVYSELIKDMTADGTHFMEDNKQMIAALSEAATSRTPTDIASVIERFRVAVEKFVIKSQGDLKARDVFHGTCLRFDPQRTGRINKDAVMSVAKALGVRIKEGELGALVTWFDTNASDLLDYNEFTKQLYGDDISTRAIKLPHLSKHAAAIMAAKTQGGGAATFAALSTNQNQTTTSIMKNGSGAMQYVAGQSSPSMAGSLPQRPSTTGGSPGAARGSQTQATSMGFSSIRRHSNPNISTNDSADFGSSSSGGMVLKTSPAFWMSQNKASMIDGLTRKEKIMQLAESAAVKIARKVAKRDLIMAERSLLQEKIKSIDMQRKNIIEDYKMRHSTK